MKTKEVKNNVLKIMHWWKPELIKNVKCVYFRAYFSIYEVDYDGMKVKFNYDALDNTFWTSDKAIETFYEGVPQITV